MKSFNDFLNRGAVYVKVGDEWEKLGEMVDTPETKLADNPVPCDLSKLTEAWSIAFETFGKAAEQLSLIFSELWEMALESCPDRRVRHLALHAKRKRTRKKNIHRIYRMLERRR